MASCDYDHQHTRDDSGTSDSTPSLFNLLGNTLVLRQTIPYLPVLDALNLAATSRSFRDLLRNTPGTFKHLDLSRVKGAQFDIAGVDHGGEIWRNVQLDENLTEDEFYSGPLRGIFSSLRRQNILQDVNTLVLDGLSVTTEFCNEILVDPSSRIRILSIRDVTNLNERKLMQALRYACRPTRADNMPRLKALYFFGKREVELLLPAPETPAPTFPPRNSRGANISTGWNQKSQQTLKESIKSEGDDWYQRRGKMVTKQITDGWAQTLWDCRETIRFDTVLCTGPRHQNSLAYGKAVITPPSKSCGSSLGVATFALGGCASCGSAPEGFARYGESKPEALPLLSPIPLHSSNVKTATRPTPIGESTNTTDGQEVKFEFIPRCLDCIRERYCFSCHQWWCEACYQVPSRGEQLGAAQQVHIVDEANGLVDHELVAYEPPKIKTPKITKSCWDCEHNCHDCIAETQKRCQGCGGGYCILHAEGSTLTWCDWCTPRRGRRYRGELY
ncbi:hypothetical protein F5Y16DRAFT_250477 [Xylariaceae sp. FL0255]|nr:hypothetical protein F5Y16DRAFT_250477 [Xylariaceae sp. FL0255]